MSRHKKRLASAGGDIERLQELAKKIRKLLDSKSPQSFLSGGGHLTEAKELLGRGKFDRWLKTEFPGTIGRSAADDRINAYSGFGDQDPKIVDKFHRTAMAILGECGPDAVSEAIEQAKSLEAGERFDKRRAMQITRRYSRQKTSSKTLANQRRKIIAALRETYGDNSTLDQLYTLLEDACCAYETIEAVAGVLGKRIPCEPHWAMADVYGLFKLDERGEWTLLCDE
jgi:hypothetical protein